MVWTCLNQDLLLVVCRVVWMHITCYPGYKWEIFHLASTNFSHFAQLHQFEQILVLAQSRDIVPFPDIEENNPTVVLSQRKMTWWTVKKKGNWYIIEVIFQPTVTYHHTQSHNWTHHHPSSCKNSKFTSCHWRKEHYHAIPVRKFNGDSDPFILQLIHV